MAFNFPHYVNECGHPDEPHVARNMCQSCYHRFCYLKKHPNASKLGKVNGKASCHPDRRMHNSNGLCEPCYHKLWRYGVDFVTIYQEQNGCCKVCKRWFHESDLNVDHNHYTGKVRGLVCLPCNGRIAAIEDPLYQETLSYVKDND